MQCFFIKAEDQGYPRSTTTDAAPSSCAYVPANVVFIRYEYPYPELMDVVMGSSPGVMITT